MQSSKAAEACNEIVERMLEIKIKGLVTIDDTQFGFMTGRAQLMRCLLLGECKRSFVEEKISCT